MKIATAIAAAALGALAMSPALAQTSAPAPGSPAAGTTNGLPQDPRATGSTRPGETLTERLDRTDGVLRPDPGIAPDMRVPAPDPNPGTTPVIPPPAPPQPPVRQ
jgi:hypothetical protein